MKTMARQLVLITVGVSLMALGTHFFLVPHALAAGGVTGLAVVVNYVFPFLPVGLLMFVGNAVLFILGLFLLGRQFGILTLYGSLLYSIFVAVLEKLSTGTQALTQDVVISLILGCALMGYGLALVFQQNASTGGTDILGKILHTYFHLDLAKGLLLADFVVVALSAVCISLEKSLYAAVGIYLQSAILDRAIAGSNRRIIMTIISKNVEEISQFINREMNRGATVYDARGAYSGDWHQVIISIVHRAEYIRIKEFIHQVDPDAFVYIGYVNEVFGEGFTFERSLPGQGES